MMTPTTLASYQDLNGQNQAMMLQNHTPSLTGVYTFIVPTEENGIRGNIAYCRDANNNPLREIRMVNSRDYGLLEHYLGTLACPTAKFHVSPGVFQAREIKIMEEKNNNSFTPMRTDFIPLLGKTKVYVWDDGDCVMENCPNTIIWTCSDVEFTANLDRINYPMRSENVIILACKRPEI